MTPAITSLRFIACRQDRRAPGMAEGYVLALPSDNDTDLAITLLAAARKAVLNDRTVTVAPAGAWVGNVPDPCFDTQRREM
jgi:hypothetical protein